MKTFKEIMMVFWAIWFKFQAFERQEVERINCNWGSRENKGLIDTIELNEGLDLMDGDVNHDVLHAKLFKSLKQAEERLELLYDMEEKLEEALSCARITAKEDKALVGAICPETMNDGKQAKSLLEIVENQIEYWENVHENILREDSAEPDTFVSNDGGYNNIHWGEAIRRGEKVIDWAHKCKNIDKLFVGMKRIDVLRKQRHITYECWLKVRYIVNVNIMRFGTSEHMKQTAAKYAIQARTMLAKKQTDMAKKEIKEREPVMCELNDVVGSYSINVEDAIDRYHAVKKLADKNNMSVYEISDMLDEEEESKPVDSFLTSVVDVLKECDGVKTQAARKLGVTIHKFNKLFSEAIEVSKVYYQ